MMQNDPIHAPRPLEPADIQATYNHGMNLYFAGLFADACHHFRLAAIYDHSGSEFILGHAFYTGTGRVINRQTAKRYFTQSILHGENANAMNSIGLMYRQGLGVPRNIFVALFWFKRSLNNEETINAAFNMAEIYRLEEGFIDLQQAANYYQIAQNGGHVNTTEFLEILREQGFVPNVQADQ